MKLDNGQTARRIYFWNKKISPSTTIEGVKERVDIQNNPKIVSKIIQSSILQQFKNTHRFKVFKKSEEHCWNIVSSKDLLQSINGLNAYNQIHFNTFFNSYNGTLSFFFVLSRSINLKFSIGKDEFEKKGIVCSDLKGKENIIFANKQSIKRFLSATGQQGNFDTQMQVLEHNQENFKVIKQTFNWLENNRNNI